LRPRSDLPDSDFERLRKLDTCLVSNAIERLKVRLRNEGFVLGSVRCMFPDLPPMLGYAATARIHTSFPPMRGRCYHERIDWWEYVASIPAPRVIVVQDADHMPGLGAFVGEIHAAIGLALNCVGYVSNGAVRDLPAVRAMGFHLFAGSVVASHSYAHIAEFGAPVEVGGLRIASGDLIHGDLDGVHSIPLSIASEIPNVASQILHDERRLIEFCRSAEFSLQGLCQRLQSCDGPPANEGKTSDRRA
jgi:4-hydroxy-4-methyl-2-oxoglutarate aldolase